MIKKYLMILVIAIFAVGCSEKDASSETGSDNNGDGKTTLEVWWNVDKANDRSGYYDAIERYEELNPDVTFDIQVLPYEQLKQKLTTTSSNGNPPDIAQGLGEWMADFNSMDILYDFTDVVNSWEGKDGISEAVWNSVSMNGKIAAFPSYLGTRARMYHENVINEVGIELPNTWDELLEAGKILKDAGIENPFGISATSARAPQELAVFVWSNDLNIVEEIGEGKYRNTWADSEDELAKAAEVFQFYKDMLDQGVISQNQTSWGYQELDQNFAQGNVAIVQNGPWIEGYKSEQPEGMADVRVDGVPPYNETPATFLEVAQWFLFKDGKNNEEAIKFLTWMGSKEGQSYYAKGNRTIRNDMELEGEWNVPFSEIAKNGRTWPPVPMGGIIDSMTQSIQKVLLGDTTPEETAIWLSEQINESLESNGLLGE
ncbi:ABC transporter substrate-binding protein [Aquibacillus salsiterrae]|uniref:Extracellular solute-binding protein n=1 Tax=Aquibacillus salsiterrae TaxID=2950439 RepID=A0A9X4AHP3_9BACI|nr:extracellular solute-binding protein [Aquibacillus salsiterrae]MDC3418540.1 extracellular solute-binding protein [Aquibacillus salsiterrae]